MIAISAAARQTPAPAVVLDRIVASIGGIPIARSDVVREYRLETFLSSGRVPASAPSGAALQNAQSRLIDQRLLETELPAYNDHRAAAQRNAARRMAALRSRFDSPQLFQAALHELGMSESELSRRLERQDEILEMINERLRPSASVTPGEVGDYYRERLLPAYKGKGEAPPLPEVQSKIKEILVQKKMNQLLDKWLAHLRREHHVELL